MSLNEGIARMKELAKQICDVTASRITGLDRLREVNVGLARIKADQKGIIAVAVDGAGKPMFSNDAKREAALVESLCANEIYMKLEQESNDLVCAAANWQNQIEFLERCYRIEELAILLQLGMDGKP